MGVPWQDILCSSILTEIACDKVVFQEICLTNEVARHREVTLLGKVPIFGKVVLAVLGNGCPLR